MCTPHDITHSHTWPRIACIHVTQRIHVTHCLHTCVSCAYIRTISVYSFVLCITELIHIPLVTPQEVVRSSGSQKTYYVVATISRLLKIVGLFCKRALQKRLYSAKGHTCYGVATISRLPKNIGLFCKIALWKRLYSSKKSCIFKELTNDSQPILYPPLTYTLRDMIHSHTWSLQGGGVPHKLFFWSPQVGARSQVVRKHTDVYTQYYNILMYTRVTWLIHIPEPPKK